MKKVRVIYCIALALMCTIFFNIKSDILAYTQITSQTLFTPSTFDTLVLNYTTLPTVTVSGSESYSISDGTCGSGHATRGVYFNNTYAGKGLDATINVKFSNCGTLNGQAIDMLLVYSDIVTSSTGSFLYWSAFGSTMMSSNEWWYNYVEHFKIKIYFYYHGSSTPINITNGYLSIFSEDENEGSGAAPSTAQYFYTTTNMAYSPSYYSSVTGRTYSNVYYGTASGSTEAGSLNCVAFRYQNTNNLEVELYGLQQRGGIGYHLQYTPLTAVAPKDPVKSVDKSESQLGDTLTYTVTQQISKRYDTDFHYSSLVFSDTIDSNLTYQSLKVYNPSGVDITNSGGTVSYNSSNKTVTYTFNSTTLNNMSYNNENYRFVITTKVNDTSSNSTVYDTSKTVINNSSTLTSNTVSTVLKAKVIIHYVNKQGKTLGDDSYINGNLLDSYNTASEIKSFTGYKLVDDSGNTTGTMTKNTTEVTYIYDLDTVDIYINKTLGKTASSSVLALDGAKFTLVSTGFPSLVALASPATTYYSESTGTTGSYVIKGVPYGTYRFTETTIPSLAYNGIFILKDSTARVTSVDVTVDSTKTYTYDLEDVPKKMNITVYKEDAETGTKTQGDAHLEGAEYTIYKNQECTDAVETITIVKNEDGTYSATSSWLLTGTYYVKETKAPEGYNIDPQVYTVSQDPSKQTEEYISLSTLSKDYVIRNDIEITKFIDKTDSTLKTNLSGAIFSATLISNPSFKNTFYSTETNEQGYCIIKDLPYGTYKITEYKVPSIAYDGQFTIGSSIVRITDLDLFITVDKSNNPTYEYTDITNVPKKMNIQIFKEDYNTGITPQGDAVLEGAQYTIYRDESCTDPIETVTITKQANGTYSATTGWYLSGTYYVKETKAPIGYNLDEQVYTVSQEPEKQTTEYVTHTVLSRDKVITNDIEIIKYIDNTDSTQKQNLIGAVFTATLNSNNSIRIDSTVSDENGYCVIKDLPYGTYTITESTVPSVAYNGEFFVNKDTIRNTSFSQVVEIDSSKRGPYVYTDINDVPKKMKITIFKEDAETGIIPQGDAHLEGAEYTFYRDEACTDVIETVTIAKNPNGTYSAESGWYLTGTYYIKETKAPVGYNLSDEVIVASIDPNMQTEEYKEISVTAKEYVIRNNIEIIKNIDETYSTEKRNLSGAVFTATLDSNNAIQGVSTVTDRNGYCVIEGLPYGTYTVEETTVPDLAYNGEFYVNGDILRVKTFKQFIEEDSSDREPYIYSDINDVPKKMNITIYKEDAETGSTSQGDSTLAGAEYTIYSDRDCSKPIETVVIAEQADGTYSATSNWYLTGTYYFKETKAPTGYLLDPQVYEVSQNPAEQTEEYISLSGTAKDYVKRNDIEIIKYIDKTDSTLKTNLSGAIFSATLVSDTSADPVVYFSTETNASGYCVIKDVPYGTYKITEYKVPSIAYGGQFTIGSSIVRITEFEYEFTVDSEYIEITDVPKKMGITIYKEDAETGTIAQGDATLAGAEYTIYRDPICMDPIETVTTKINQDGNYVATSGWYLLGTYYVKETKAPEGYNLDETVYTVSKNPEEQTEEYSEVAITSKDTIIRNDIEITKYIAETTIDLKKKLSGAVFTATLNSNNSVSIDSTVTDENGYCIIKDLPYGTYTIRETTVPEEAYDGYFYVNGNDTKVNLFNETIKVDKSNNGPYVYADITDVPKKMNITIYKEDIETGTIPQGDATLAGAEYTIYRDRDCTDAIETVVTAKNPDGTYSATSGWYMLGTYYVKETKAPVGYKIDEQVYEVTKEASNQNIEYVECSVTSKDEVIRNDIEITKYIDDTYSTDKQNLSGAVFTATLDSNNSVHGVSTVTNEVGYCIIKDLPYGTYTVTETKVPDIAYNGQFHIDGSQAVFTSFNQVIEVDSSNNGPYIYTDITDVPKKMNITIYKEDAETGTIPQGDATLEGAEYTFYRDAECTDSIETVTITKQADGTYSATSNWYLTGTYYVKETKAPEGYNLDEQVYEISQNAAEQTEEYCEHVVTSRENVIKNDIEITKFIDKTESSLKVNLSGAIFSATLKSNTDVIYFSTETNESGYCIIKDLPYGNYEIREYQVPSIAYDGQFTIGSSVVRIKTFDQFIRVDKTVSSSYDYTNITDVPKKMNITIYKEDAETGLITQGDATLAGAEYTVYSDEECTNEVEKLTIQKDKDGIYSAKSGWYIVGTYYIKETKAPVGYNIDEQVYKVEQNPEEQTTEYTTHSIVSKDYVVRNDIEIIKYLDETASTEKQNLSGAIFGARLNSSYNIQGVSTVTDENGYCVIKDLPYGTYTVEEITTPSTAYNGEFYINGSSTRNTSFTHFIEVDEEVAGPYVYTDITDVPKKMNITIYKEDAETGTTPQGEARLEGAEYTVYRDKDCTDIVETLTIEKQENGTYSATSGWYLTGTYYIKETKAPIGYNIDEQIYIVEQIPGQQISEYTSLSITSKENVIRNDIEITKYIEQTDSTEKQNLSGAIFTATLNTNNNVKFNSSETDNNGYCIIEGLPYGNYTITEIKVPDMAYNGEFYINGNTARETVFNQFIEINGTKENSYVYSDITDVAKKMNITITKEDSETGLNAQGDAVLEGAEYTIYSDEECTEEVEKLTIEKQADGTYSATSGWYMVGTYYVKETKAPVGYNLDEQLYKVEQKPAEQTQEFSSHIINSKEKVIEGVVRVKKFEDSSDSTLNPAVGSKLRLTLNSNPEIYYEAIVDENGFLEFVDTTCKDSCYPYTIPYGVYTISEIEAGDSGKNIFIDDIQTEIRYQDQVQTHIVTEDYVRMKFTVQKQDEETKKVITGAVFKIWNVEKQQWYSENGTEEFTINDEGYFSLNGTLEAGSYVLYETKAPYGYYLEDSMRVGAKGYEFVVGVEKNGEVVVYHGEDRQVLPPEVEITESGKLTTYSYTVVIENPPQKAVIRIKDLAEQLLRINQTNTEYGILNTPEFDKLGLEDVEFDIIAKENIYTEEGTLRYTKGQVVSHVTTDGFGKGNTLELYLGEYEVIQTKVPEGYVLDETPRVLDIVYTNQFERVQYLDLIYENEIPEVNLEFEKVFEELKVSQFYIDETKAVFGIYTAENIKNNKGQNIIAKGELVDIMTTDKNNKVKNNVNLPEGNYYVKELAVSNPYKLSDSMYELNVDYSNTNSTSVLNLTINNGKIENYADVLELEFFVYPEDIYDEYDISKITDRERLEELAEEYGIANKTYGIFNDNECKNPVITSNGEEARFTTDENGRIYIPDMLTGTYYIKEIVAPFGYEISNEIVKVVIDGSKKLTLVKVKEPLVWINLLQKRDTFTKDVIEGVTFEISNEDGKVIYTGITDENGIVKMPIKYFENGKTYYYQEVKAPKMYQINNEKQAFVAQCNEEKSQWTLNLIKVANERKTKEFILRKTDNNTGETLEGCEFTIVLLDENGNEYINEYGEKIYLVKNGVTGENGEYVIENAPYGTYKFIEITPPDGYELNENIQGNIFTIDEKSPEKIIYEVTNTGNIVPTGDIEVVAVFSLMIISLIGVATIIKKRKSFKA